MKVTVEVASKRFNREPQTIKQGFHGEQQSSMIKLKEPTLGQIIIEDRKIPCQVREIESSNADGQQSNNSRISPFTLLRQYLRLSPLIFLSHYAWRKI
jgi:hypothetical protein